jgi:hypothetical protein
MVTFIVMKATKMRTFGGQNNKNVIFNLKKLIRKLLSQCQFDKKKTLHVFGEGWS